MPVGKLLVELRRQKNIKRWAGELRHHETDVLHHTGFVLMIMTFLAEWEVYKFGNEVDFAKMYKIGLFHDGSEPFTGDILSGVKRATPEMRQAVPIAEQYIWDTQISKLLPKTIRDEYREYFLNPKELGFEGKILAAADNLDALFECVDELSFGNTRFEPKLQQVCKSLVKIDLKSLQYFLKYSLQDLGLPMSSYGADMAEYIDNLEFEE